MVDSILVAYELYESEKIVGWLLGELHTAPTERDKEIIDELMPQAGVVITETKAESAQQELEYISINNNNPLYMKRKTEINAIAEKFRPFYKKLFKDKAETMIAWHPTILTNFLVGRIVHGEDGKDYLQRSNQYENPTTYCTHQASEKGIPIIWAYPSEKQYEHFWEPQSLEEAYEGLQELFSGDKDIEKIKQRIEEKIKDPIVAKEIKEKFHDEERNPLFAEIIYTAIGAEKKPLVIYGAGHSKEVLENLKDKGVQSKKIV